MADMNAHLQQNGEAAVRERFDANRRVPGAPSWRIIDPTKFAGQPVPPREWIVEQFIPAATVAILSGEGSGGKSTLALQLAVARSLGKAWLTTLPKPGRTLVLSAEDDEDELHRRLDAIRQHYGAQWEDLADVRLVDLVGEDAVLGAATTSGTIAATPLFKRMVAEIESFKPDLVILDALADMFAGDEIRRAQARQFVGLLKRPAKQHRCAFLMLAHPSLTGLSSGTGASGSTAWGNSVRSRMFLEHAKASDGSQPDPDMRTLIVNKSNYGPAGVTVTLKWQDGVYLPQARANSLDRMAVANKADETFLTLLTAYEAERRFVSSTPSITYAPKVFSSDPRSGGLGKQALADAMNRLFAAGRIKTATHGRPSDPRSHIAIATSNEVET